MYLFYIISTYVSQKIIFCVLLLHLVSAFLTEKLKTQNKSDAVLSDTVTHKAPRLLKRLHFLLLALRPTTFNIPIRQQGCKECWKPIHC